MSADNSDGSSSDHPVSSPNEPVDQADARGPRLRRVGTTMRWLRSLYIGILPIGLLLALFIYTGLRGIEFGYHVDESWAQLIPLGKSLETWTFLPSFYLYPSLNYWMNLSGLVPHLIAFLAAGERGATLASHLTSVVYTHPFRLELRGMRLILTSLSLVWVYIFVLRWRKSRLEAFLSAAILGLSWEVAYHARWIAPDDIVMQFAAMTILFVGLAVLEPKNPWWSRLGAVAAGLATGTKYTAGLLVLPVLFVVGWQALADRERRAERIWRSLLAAVAVFGVTFLITTPGSVLQPWHFLRDLRLEQTIYAEAGHIGHTVWPGANHLSLMAGYFVLVLFSHYPIAAVFLTTFSIPGVFFLFRESRVLGFALLIFPVTFIAFLATQKVMFPRHLLSVAPFLALLAGRGIAGLLRSWRNVAFRAGLAAMVGATLALNGYWLVDAANSIFDRGSDRFLVEAAAFVGNHPSARFLASPAVAAEMHAAGVKLPANLILATGNDVEYVLVYGSEAMDVTDWTANRFDLTVRTFGPQMDNFNYYPAEYGDDQIVLLTFSHACQAGVNLVEGECPLAEWNSLLRSRPPTHRVPYPNAP